MFQTDGRIEALDLELIKDDKSFFPIYNPALNVSNGSDREDTRRLTKLFAPISKKLTTEELQKLNAKVDVEGQLEDQVAEEWLSQNGFI